VFVTSHISPTLPDVFLLPVVTKVVDADARESGVDVGVIGDSLMSDSGDGGGKSDGAALISESKTECWRLETRQNCNNSEPGEKKKDVRRTWNVLRHERRV